MSNTIGFGQAAVNNTIDYGQGATDNTINWGKSQTLSPSGETNITGTPSTPTGFSVNSFSFDGVDDYFIMPQGLLTSQDFSLSIWFKGGVNTGGQQLIAGNGNFWNFGLTKINGAGLNTDIAFWNGSSWVSLTNGSTGDNQWHNLVVTFEDTANNLKAYYDGNLTFNGTYNVSNSDSITGIGYNSTYGRYWEGLIDEIGIWTSELSQSDVNTIYGTGAPSSIASLNPLINFRMGENATWNGATWTMTSVGTDTRIARSINMVEANRTTDVPTASSFANTKSILLDGVDDFVDCGQVTQIQNTNELSVSCWFNYKTLTSSVNGIVSKDSTSRSNGNWYISTQNATIRFLLKTANGQDALNSGTISLNSWNNLLCVWNGSTMKIYINGTLNNSISLSNATGTLGLNTTDVKIGRRLVGSINDGFFNGGVDEVAVWNSDQSANASAIYNSAEPSNLATYSPISWYRCGDGDTAPTLTDNGSGGNDGTMTNFTTFSTDVPT